MEDLRDLAVLIFGALIALALGVLMWIGLRPPIEYTPSRTTVTVCCAAGVHGSGGGPTTTTTTGAP